MKRPAVALGAELSGLESELGSDNLGAGHHVEEAGCKLVSELACRNRAMKNRATEIRERSSVDRPQYRKASKRAPPSLFARLKEYPVR